MTINLKRSATAAALALALSFAAAPMHAQYGPPPPPPGQGGPGGWDAPPPDMQAAMRQGYQDGIAGAQRDVENHRRPNVNNRDEYRHPNVPHHLRRDYRVGFQRGYNNGIQHLLGGPGPRPY